MSPPPDISCADGFGGLAFHLLACQAISLSPNILSDDVLGGLASHLPACQAMLRVSHLKDSKSLAMSSQVRPKVGSSQLDDCQGALRIAQPDRAAGLLLGS